MLILRIKRAEVALADGRLDEAFELASDDKMRAHRRGQDLAGQVARALLKRGNEHLNAGRLVQAGGDCERAYRLAGNLADISELRTKITSAMAQKQQQEQRKADAVLMARRQIDMGQLSVGEGVLRANFNHHAECDGEAETSHGIAVQAAGDFDGKAAALMQDVATRRAVVESVLAKASEALKRGDWECAAEHLVHARDQRVANGRIGTLVNQISKLLSDRIQSAMNTGRLDTASLMLKRLSQLTDRNVEIESMHQTMDLCRSVWSRIERHELRRAEEAARRLAAVLPSSDWIEACVQQLTKLNQAMDQLRAGPLGLLDETSHGGATPLPSSPARQGPPALPAARPAKLSPRVHNAIPDRFILQVDGVGSFLVLTGRRISIGPVSGAHPVDLGLVAESNAPVVSIERQEEDYFLRSAASVAVNEKPTTGKLLHSGDRIAASAKCRLSFRVPSPASTSALLDLHGARLMRGDVKRVVLMDREIILGAGPATHVRDDQMPEQAVLCIHDGQFTVRTKSAWTKDGNPADRNTTIALGSHVKVGDVSFVVTPA